MKLRSVAFLLVALCAGLSAASAESVSGIVRNRRGSPIEGAAITVASSAGSVATITGADGAFALEVPGVPPFRLRVLTTGRGPIERDVAANENAIRSRSPRPSRGHHGNGFATPRDRSTLAVGGRLPERSARTPAPPRRCAPQIPGFSPSRSGSRTANPTSWALLRGLGASGTSRALVLDDGIPANDPFGGWVYWGRVPEPALDRVEVVEGGSSDLWGNAALGGVIQLVRRSDAENSAEISAWAGSEVTAAGTVHTRRAAGRFRATADVAAFEPTVTCRSRRRIAGRWTPGRTRATRRSTRASRST